MSKFRNCSAAVFILVAPALVVFMDIDHFVSSDCELCYCNSNLTECDCPELCYFTVTLDPGTPAEAGCDGYGALAVDETDNVPSDGTGTGNVYQDAEGFYICAAIVWFEGKVCNRTSQTGTLKFWQEVDEDVRMMFTPCSGEGQLENCSTEHCFRAFTSGYIDDYKDCGPTYCTRYPNTICEAEIACKNAEGPAGGTGIGKIKDVDAPGVPLLLFENGTHPDLVLCEASWEFSFRTNLIWECGGTKWLVSTIPWETCGAVVTTNMPAASCDASGTVDVATFYTNGSWEYTCSRTLERGPGTTNCSTFSSFDGGTKSSSSECPVYCPCENCD